MNFFAEMKRRKVLQVAAIYAVVAWLLIQIVATVEEPLRLPEWFDTAVIVLLIVGFPITLIISWAFNVTPEVLVRDKGGESSTDIGGRRIEYALIGLLIVAMLWLFYRVDFQADEPFADLAPPEIRPCALPDSVAVLPFSNLSPDPDKAYFAAGMHEELLTQLAKIKGVNVIARTSVLRYANDPPPVPDIANQLNVETIMEGGVRFAGDNVRVTAQLIDGTSGAHLWSDAYDGDLTDVFAIQADIASAIASALEAELLPETRARFGKRPTTSPAAYALYLEAKDLLNNVRYSDSVVALNRAIELDPGFALAYAYRGYVSAWAVVNAAEPTTTGPDATGNLVNRALDDANRALALDPDLGAAWTVRATVNLLTWRWRSAEQDFKRALALSPNHTELIRNYANFLATLGDCEEAMPMIRRGAQLDPNILVAYFNVTITAHLCHQYDEALRAAEIGAEIAPDSAIAIVGLGHCYVPGRDAAAASKYFRSAEELISDDTGQIMAGLVYSYGLLGLDDDARRIYGRLRQWSETHFVGAGDWMMAYLGLGDAETAYAWLGRVLELSEKSVPDPGYLLFVVAKANAHEDPVLDQPRFRELFDRIEAISRSR